MFSRLLVRVTFPLAAANVMNQAARMVMAIVGPVLAIELGLSAVELGMLAASLFAAYAAAQLPLGVALDAFGARRVQTVLMLLAALGFAIFALSPGFAGLVAARIVLGVGISAGLMALIRARLPQPLLHEACTTGKRYGAGDLLRHGIIGDAVPESEVLPRAIARAQELAGKGGETLKAIKRGLYGSALAVLEQS